MQDWDFSDFAENPAMPFNHDWEGPPVGVHLDWIVTNRITSKYTGPALLLTSLFAAADEMRPEWGDSLFRLIQAGMLRANSVGFIPGVITVVHDEQERQELGLGRWGDILSENKLLENSPTLLGANQGALTILNSAKGSNRLKPNDMLLIRELNRIALHDKPDKWIETDSEFVAMARILFPSEKGQFSKATDIDRPIIVEAEFEVDNSETETEKQLTAEDLMLSKMTQLVSLVEMSMLSLQVQLDSISDGLATLQQELLISTTEEPTEPESLAAELANLILH
jgi:hypothetical protein